MKLFTKNINPLLATVSVSLIIILFLNHAFFVALFKVYSLNQYGWYLLSLVVALILTTILCFSFFTLFFKEKIILPIMLVISSLSAYFMDSYNAIIDQTMLDNFLKTDTHEVLDLLSFKLFFYLGIFAILPSLILMKISFKPTTFYKRLRTHFLTMSCCLIAILILVASSSKFYASFFREHKELRYRVNPLHGIYSAIKLIKTNLPNSNTKFEYIGLDAKIPDSDTERDLVILVLGETARSDRFSLNGYQRKTNPLLEKENIISFKNVFSCGTSTAHSVPCMFSNRGEERFEHEKADQMDNAIDVLIHTHDVNVLWRDNNSDSKGVALRVNYQDFKGPIKNTICDEECRDEGMLVGLQDHINKVKEKDILIVLHQMGSHGPAYYKRYPKAFEKFNPICKTNELSECSLAEISNAYDNTILYSDYFLSKVIALLKNNDEKFETAMLYISDHGESLGENGVYLHSLPKMLAPKEQIHVPAILWFGKKMAKEINLPMLKKNEQKNYTHDHLFHTLLGLFEIQTEVYRNQLDIIGPYYIQKRT